MAEFTQVPFEAAETGRFAALLEGNSEEFSAALGLQFQRERDDLDDLDAAKIRTRSGVYGLFVYHLHAPKRAMEIYISEKAADPARDLAEVLAAIGGVGLRIIWKAEGL